MNITKLDRWSLELQEFDISLEFIQGKLNTVADVTSRLRMKGCIMNTQIGNRRLIQKSTWMTELRKYWILHQNH